MLKPGSRVGPFEVISSLGAGGMGEVYRARDPRLERDVALKVLPAHKLADETARMRMLREARLAASLNHPNVCTIHEVGEADGHTYIAMELVSGQALSARLANGPIAVDEALRLGQQLADALAHAHAHGLVHRDFKGGNVIVTPEGRPKVLDFGLAKQVASEEVDTAATTMQAPASLTQPGVVVGTLAYMAPEQLRGREADARSDVWALGVVLYEMVSGWRPFAGGSTFELSSAILNEAPRPLPAGVPPALALVVERCLAKEPAQRYQRAGEVRSALEALRSGGMPAAWPGWRSALLARRRQAMVAAVLAGVAIVVALDVDGLRTRLLRRSGDRPRAIRMAVLPFANLTGEPGQEYLSDGFTQELITQLGRLHPESLSVIARTSVMRYKKGNTPVDQIGRELKVDYVLEGSAQREANRVRITAELVQVRDQTQLWADSYERDFSGLLAVQGEVAQRVATALALKLLPAEQARLTSARIVDPEAYEAYLKGSYHWQKLTPEDIDTALRYFELALAKDPSCAPAYAGLAWVWAVRQQMGIAPPAEAGPKAKEAALRALALDDNSAAAHEALALVRTWIDWDWRGAEAEWRRALALDPNAPNTHAYYAHFLAITGHTDDAVSHGERALELDPFNSLFRALHAMVLYFDRRYDDAIAVARSALALRPDEGIARSALRYVFISKGMRDEQLAVQREQIARDPGRLAAFEQGLAEGGYEGAQRRLADLLAERYEKAAGVPNAGALRVYLPWAISLRYRDAGDYENAMDWLEKAFEVRDPNLPYVAGPLYDPLRSNPRFQDLMRRMNLSPT